MLIIKVWSFLNGLGKSCTEGKDCPADQICNKEKCTLCEDGNKPDKSQLKCNGAWDHLVSTILRSICFLILACLMIIVFIWKYNFMTVNICSNQKPWTSLIIYCISVSGETNLIVSIVYWVCKKNWGNYSIRADTNQENTLLIFLSHLILWMIPRAASEYHIQKNFFDHNN